MQKRQRIMRSPSGHRCGESHPRAKLTNADVDLVRALHDEGLGYKRIAEKFEAPKSTIRDICKCLTR